MTVDGTGKAADIITYAWRFLLSPATEARNYSMENLLINMVETFKIKVRKAYLVSAIAIRQVLFDSMKRKSSFPMLSYTLFDKAEDAAEKCADVMEIVDDTRKVRVHDASFKCSRLIHIRRFL